MKSGTCFLASANAYRFPLYGVIGKSSFFTYNDRSWNTDPLSSCRAGGPGDSKADVKWLDEKLRSFLEDGNW